MQIIHWRPLNEREHSTRTAAAAAAAAAWSRSWAGVRSRCGRLSAAAVVGGPNPLKYTKYIIIEINLDWKKYFRIK